VRGGGGITPDIVVRADSAQLAQIRVLQTALGRHLTQYQDALTAFALDARGRRLVTSPTFQVTPEIRQAFLQVLAQRGVILDAPTLRDAGAFLDRQIGTSVARYGFGRAGELRRLATDDPVLAQAARLAGRARTPNDLFALAQAEAPAQAAARN
jgi:hypothetical protein